MSPWLVKEEDRYKYGLREQEVIATNQKAEDVLVAGFVPNPFWHSFQKNIAAVHNPDDEQYIQCFENELRLPLKAFLISSLPNCSWILNVLHLGFGADKYANPIVIHVCIQTPHYFTDNKAAALEVVQGMEKIIKEKLDNQKHEKDMHEKTAVPMFAQAVIPAFKYHKATLEAMESTLQYARSAIEKAEKRQVMCPEMDLSSQIQSNKEEEIRCVRRLKEAQDYSIHAGYVYAASEEWRKVATFNGILDWALIRNACIDPRNQNLRSWDLSKSSETSIGHQINSSMSVIQDRSHFSMRRVSTSKPLSQTTGWKACELNVIQAIVHNQNSTSDEHVCIGDDIKKAKEKMSDGGDSGALIYSIDVDVEGNTVPVPMTMICAGNKDGFEGFQGDVTYATPIEEVLRDIESEMGWENGSLKFS
ncbi:hypothetical protein BPAE_0280g00020 [Botrytis paeoniae]|uniref:Uncharacterized protein n=1 Tax=Botrytis paeoniae TaxID=278948 RepID=A0A4Z1F7T8_9HELO|nr:hypothetical protein BPAE_0280g00020 [Botrytis paeoniae]